MKKLVGNSDLGIPYTTVLNRAIVKLVQSMFGINKINHLYAEASTKEGVEFAQAVLDQLEVSIAGEPRLDVIPRKGAFVLISNHPYGALDGLILMVLVARIRPDVKFLGNFPLSRIDTLNDFFLPVDPFYHKNRRNIKGARSAVEHLKSGKPLVVFPAGDVSTYQKAFSKIEDNPWSLSVAKLIRKAGVPVIPTYVDGSNSLKFHLLGKIHPMLQTVRLPLELTNKKGCSVPVVMGAPVSAKLIREIGEVQSISDFLRANVYCLRSLLASDASEDREGAKAANKAVRGKSEKEETGGAAEEIAPVNPDLLQRELDAIADTRMVTRVGDMCLYCAPMADIPMTMHEIARLREEAARETGRSLPDASDPHDDLYRHLFVWDARLRAVVGAYRVGFGDELLEKRGFEGFYSYTLFEFSRHLQEVLKQSIELGSSFIVSGYACRSQTMLLLWRGVMHVLLENPSYRYLMGPVTMPSGYAVAAKWLLVDYVKANHWNSELARYAVPRNGVGALGRAVVDESLVRSIRSADAIDKLVRDVDPSGQGMPMLMRKYLQLGGRVMGFNVDPAQGDALDAMLILDLQEVPKAEIVRMAR